MIRRFINILILVLLLVEFNFANKGLLKIQLTTKETIITAYLYLTNNNYKLLFPERTKLYAIMNNNKPINFEKRDTVIYIDDVMLKNYTNIMIKYSVPNKDISFARNDWLFFIDKENIEYKAELNFGNDYKGFIIPFISLSNDIFFFSQNDKPLLISGKYDILKYKDSLRMFYLVYQYKSFIGIETCFDIYKTYENILNTPNENNIYLIQIPDKNNTVYRLSNNIFISINNTTRAEVIKGFLKMWFSSIFELSNNEANAFIDLYSRFIDDRNKLQTNAANIVVIPSYEYYLRLLSDKIKEKELKNVNVDMMFKNYALAHFAYYTVLLDNFIRNVRDYSRKINTKNKFNITNLFYTMTNNGTPKQYIDFFINYLYPFNDSIVYDIGIKALNESNIMVYRNSTNIPDIIVSYDGDRRYLNWGTNLNIILTNTKKFIFVDFGNKIPQLNFLNDKIYFSLQDRTNMQRIADIISKMKYLPSERFVEILNIEKIRDLKNISYKLNENEDVYIIIVKIMAPINNQLIYGLKEIILGITPDSYRIIDERVRL